MGPVLSAQIIAEGMPAPRSGFPEVHPAGGDTATPLNLRKRLRFLTNCGVRPGRRVLDGGCGRGEYVAALRRAGIEAFGVEFLADKVKAQVGGVPAGTIVRADLQHLPYADGAFDVVFLNEVMEHVPDERLALAEAFRVLQPGGALIVLSPNRLFPFETHGVSLRRSGRQVPPSVPFVPYIPLGLGRKIFSYWARNYWPSELAELIASARFRIVSRGFLWQTFENISGRQPRLITISRPVLQLLAGLCERLPLIRRLGVSQAIVAERPVLRSYKSSPDARSSRAPVPPAADPARVDVLGIQVSAIDMPRALAMIDGWIARGERQYVCVTGVHGVMESQRDAELRRIHNEAGMVTPDGMPLVWLARRAGFSQVDRVYGPDLLLACSELSVRQGYRHFFYGGGAGVPELLAERLSRRFPGLRVAGTYSPPFRPLLPDEDDELVTRLNAAGADIVWVGLSTPKQERWMHEHRHRLMAPVLIGVGAAFDFHAGVKRQAPRWIQRSGFEWLFRLAQEPRRLWRRYSYNNVRFVAGLLRELFGSTVVR